MAGEKKEQVLELDPPVELTFKGEHQLSVVYWVGCPGKEGRLNHPV